MTEKIPNMENAPIEKQQVIDAYQEIIKSGVTNPDDMNLEDPAVIAANDIYYKYFGQERRAAAGDPEKEARVNFEQTMFYLDAGFIDLSYAEDFLLDFAQEDIGNIEDTYPQLAAEMKKKVAEYKTKLSIEDVPEDKE